MLKIEKKPTEVIEIFGKQVTIKKPTVKQLAHYSEKVKAGATEQVVESINLLKEIGIPEEILNDLDTDSFAALIEYIFTPKKK